ncbi:MAG: M23 family metallopeptidase [Clostridia bacterium]|nr:M23 family metallopeptidase [Clostridia bacterium]
MDNKDLKNTDNKNKKGSDPFCKIIFIQFFACAFMVALLFLVCKLGGAKDLKEKYKQIMSDNVSFAQVVSSAKEVAESVMKPVSASNTIEVIERNETDEEKEEVKEETETEKKEEDTYEKSDERTVSQVMSIFSDSDSIISPAHGAITSRFGYRTDPISGITKLHSAVDIAVNEGTRVSAAWDGIVTKAGYDDTAGNYVWMVHKNGCETLYCHCSKLLVSKGDVIRAGEYIALSGSTGYSTGPHLHFGIKKEGQMIDPLNYLPLKDGKI